ncbi:MAG: hypothetical protein AAB620_01230 [Patescibacteria group bacterium]
MAVVFQKKRRAQQYLILTFAIVVVVSAIVLWYGFNKKEAKQANNAQSLPAIPMVRVNLDVLKSAELEKLEPFARPRPFEGQAGRENPFLPY